MFLTVKQTISQKTSGEQEMVGTIRGRRSGKFIQYMRTQQRAESAKKHFTKMGVSTTIQSEPLAKLSAELTTDLK